MTDFGVLFSGGGGGVRGDASGSENQFDDTTFLVVFIISWVLIGLIVIAAIILVVVFDRVKVVHDFMTGKTSRERKMKNRKLKVQSWEAKPGETEMFTEGEDDLLI